MAHTHLSALQQLDFGWGEMDCVRENGFGCEEAVVVVDIRIVFLVREKRAHESDFGPIFGDVGLDGEVLGFCQGS